MPTQQELGEHLDLSDRQIRELQRLKVFPKGSGFDEARIAYIRRLREQAAGRMGNGGGLDLTNERARLAAAQADKTELELAQLRGELIPLAQAQDAWSAMVGASRAKFLTLAARLAPRAVGMTEQQIERLTRDMVYEALAELAAWKPEGADDEPDADAGHSAGDADMGAAADADG
ncbi:hypothetical protein [Chitinimonas lacunae]|uniref:Terminase small subunit n=1 Tax=Chitinimonas lacunae TaxID=1963018 RepID=A0ABV8MN31_9NEIS